MALCSDDFNRANGAIGSNWIEDAGEIAIVSNKAETQLVNEYNRARYVTELDSPDHYAEAVCGGKAGSNNGGVTVRQQNVTQTYYLGGYIDEEHLDGYRIQKLVDGEATDIDTAVSVTGVHTLRLEVAGAVQRLYVDGGGEPVASGVDSAITTGHYAGIETWSNNGGRWDNWAAADLDPLPPNDAKIVVRYT